MNKVPIDQIKENPKNPRQTYDQTELDELKASMTKLGQLTPLIIDEKGIILAGHRRHRAAKQLGWKTLNCEVLKDASPFTKSATLIAENASRIKFNAWEHREAIYDIYWNEFLEEYYPKSKNDKGYATFAEHLGLSGAHIKKIIESMDPTMKKKIDALKEAGAPANIVDEIMSAPLEDRATLINQALHIKKNKQVRDDKLRDEIRRQKRHNRLQKIDTVPKANFRFWIRKIQDLNTELTDTIIEKGDRKQLETLNQELKKLMKFHHKLNQHLQ